MNTERDDGSLALLGIILLCVAGFVLTFMAGYMAIAELWRAVRWLAS